MERITSIKRASQTEFYVGDGDVFFTVISVGAGGFSCSCKQRSCGHRTLARASLGMGIGTCADITVPAPAENDGLLDAEEFDADAGRDTAEEIDYIRSGREKRNMGC